MSVVPFNNPRAGGTFDTSGGGGDDGGMESRVTALETKWDAVVPTLATKSDVQTVSSDLGKELSDLRTEMHKGFSDMVKWIVGVAFVGMAAFITIMTFVLNNAAPKTPAAQQSTPIIINVPPAGQGATTPAPPTGK